MNRYRSGGPSQATANTLCQKCLKRGHYSFECTASQQSRPYVSRPSRTQQLLNPKLAPKITEAVPKIQNSKPPEDSKEDKAKRKRSEDESKVAPRKRSRSASSSSSDTVSTISTGRSRSRSRSPPRKGRSDLQESGRGLSKPGKVSVDQHAPQEDSTKRTQQRHRSPPSERSPERSSRYRGRQRTRSRSPSASTQARRIRSRSRSSYRRRDADRGGNKGAVNNLETSSAKTSEVRQRSLSPYSKRLALTQAKTREENGLP